MRRTISRIGLGLSIDGPRLLALLALVALLGRTELASAQIEKNADPYLVHRGHTELAVLLYDDSYGFDAGTTIKLVRPGGSADPEINATITTNAGSWLEVRLDITPNAAIGVRNIEVFNSGNYHSHTFHIEVVGMVELGKRLGLVGKPPVLGWADVPKVVKNQAEVNSTVTVTFLGMQLDQIKSVTIDDPEVTVTLSSKKIDEVKAELAIKNASPGMKTITLVSSDNAKASAPFLIRAKGAPVEHFDRLDYGDPSCDKCVGCETAYHPSSAVCTLSGPHVVRNPVSMPQNPNTSYTLSFVPGAEITFKTGGMLVLNSVTLIAKGTAEQPITLRSTDKSGIILGAELSIDEISHVALDGLAAGFILSHKTPGAQVVIANASVKNVGVFGAVFGCGNCEFRVGGKIDAPGHTGMLFSADTIIATKAAVNGGNPAFMVGKNDTATLDQVTIINATVGIKAEGQLTLSRSRISAWTTTGVDLNMAAGVIHKIENNVFDAPIPGAPTTAILLRDGADALIRFNTLEGGGVSDATGIWLVNSGTLVGNLIGRFGTTGLKCPAADLTALSLTNHSYGSGCNYYSGSGCIDDSLPGDRLAPPIYLGDFPGNYRLSGKSHPRLFDAIEPQADYPLTDYEGRTRIGKLDIGAFETAVITSVSPSSVMRGSTDADAVHVLTIGGHNFLGGIQALVRKSCNGEAQLGDLSGWQLLDANSMQVTLALSSTAALGLVCLTHTDLYGDGLSDMRDDLLTVVNAPPKWSATTANCVAGHPCKIPLSVVDPEGGAVKISAKVDPPVDGVTVSVSGMTLEVTLPSTTEGTSVTVVLSASDDLDSVEQVLVIEAKKNTGPSAPTIVAPLKPDKGLIISADGLTTFENAVDATPVDGFPTRYRCSFSMVSDFPQDEALTVQVTVNEQPGGQTSCKLEDTALFTEDTVVYVRVEALDGADETLTASTPTDPPFQFLFSTTDNPPPVPVVKSPSDGTTLTAAAVDFVVTPGPDPEGATVTVELQLASDPELTQVVETKTAAVTTIGQDLTLSAELKDKTTYYWRVRATAGTTNSEWSPARKLVVDSSAVLPSVPTLVAPANGDANVGTIPVFVVNNSAAISDGKLSYVFQLDTAASFDSGALLTLGDLPPENGPTSSWVIEKPLVAGTTYYWRVRASNGTSLSEWSSAWAFTVSADVVSPRAPLLVRPVKGAQLPSGVAPELAIFNPEDGLSADLTASFAIYSDPELRTSVLSVSGVVLQPGTQTAWTAALVLPEGAYYWRARFARGTAVSSPWSEVEEFSIVAAPTSSENGSAKKGGGCSVSASQGAHDVDAAALILCALLLLALRRREGGTR